MNLTIQPSAVGCFRDNQKGKKYNRYENMEIEGKNTVN